MMVSPTVLEVTVNVDKIEAERLSAKANENTKSSYKLNVALSEKERRTDELTLGFVLELTGQPQLAKIAVTGTAKLAGSEADIKEGLAPKGPKSPPRVVDIIYERVYGLVFVVSGSMRLPHPLPNLLKKTT
jgi:hypothetical protein